MGKRLSVIGIAAVFAVLVGPKAADAAARPPRAVLSISVSLTTQGKDPRTVELFGRELIDRLEVQDIAVMRLADRVSGRNLVEEGREKQLLTLSKDRRQRVRFFDVSIRVSLIPSKKTDASGTRHVNALATVSVRDYQTRRPSDAFRLSVSGRGGSATTAQDLAVRSLAQRVGDRLGEVVLPAYAAQPQPLPPAEEPPKKGPTPQQRYGRGDLQRVFLAVRDIDDATFADFLRILRSTRHDPDRLIHRVLERPDQGSYRRVLLETYYTPASLLELIQGMREFEFRSERVSDDTVYLTFQRERVHGIRPERTGE